MWWHTVTHGRGSEGGNWPMEWVASTLHTTSEHGVSSITTADAHTSAASSRLNWRPLRFKWTRTFRRKTRSVFCACAVTFQTQSTKILSTAATCFGRINPSSGWVQVYNYVRNIIKGWRPQFMRRRTYTVCPLPMSNQLVSLATQSLFIGTVIQNT